MPEPLPGPGSAAGHAASLAFFAFLSVLFTWPLAAHLADGVLGAGPGDNLVGLRNIWWARTALFGPPSLFWTDALFAPLGTGLVLHAFAPLQSSLAGAAIANPVGAYNAALVAAVFLNLVIWKRPALRRAPPVATRPNRVWRLLPAVFGGATVLVLPMIIAAVRLWQAGDYESQVYFWRSAPPGIDLAALVLGNPANALVGRWSGGAYAALGLDRFESAAWIGAATIVVIVSGFERWRTSVEARSLAWLGGLFFVWSLGPYLQAFGYTTAFMLPQTVLRFVPVVANARVPGRAFVVVLLASALLASMALATIAGGRRRLRITMIALGALLVDFWPAPQPWIPLARPPVYELLLRQPPGIVLEIPFGWRDGFGQRGNLDHRVLLYQSEHQHPLAGGFIARLSGRIKRAYDSDPVLGPLLDLSEGRPPASFSNGAGAPPPACRLTCGVRYVVVDEERASHELQLFVAHVFSLRLLGRSGARALYAVDETDRT